MTSYIRCFVSLGSVFASTGRYLSIYWNTTTEVNTPHALRARVVIVYILVPVRVHTIRDTRFYLFLSFFV